MNQTQRAYLSGRHYARFAAKRGLDPTDWDTLSLYLDATSLNTARHVHAALKTARKRRRKS